jgi:hypothetical protein
VLCEKEKRGLIGEVDHRFPRTAIAGTHARHPKALLAWVNHHFARVDGSISGHGPICTPAFVAWMGKMEISKDTIRSAIWIDAVPWERGRLLWYEPDNLTRKQKIVAPRTDRDVVSAKYSTSTVVVEGEGTGQIRRFHCSSQARVIALGGVWRL